MPQYIILPDIACLNQPKCPADKSLVKKQQDVIDELLVKEGQLVDSMLGGRIAQDLRRALLPM